MECERIETRLRNVSLRRDGREKKREKERWKEREGVVEWERYAGKDSYEEKQEKEEGRISESAVNRIQKTEMLHPIRAIMNL